MNINVNFLTHDAWLYVKGITSTIVLRAEKNILALDDPIVLIFFLHIDSGILRHMILLPTTYDLGKPENKLCYWFTPLKKFKKNNILF